MPLLCPERWFCTLFLTERKSNSLAQVWQSYYMKQLAGQIRKCNLLPWPCEVSTQVPKAPWTSYEKLHIKHGISVPAAIWRVSPKKKGCRHPLPCKVCHWVTRESLWCCHAREWAGSWQLAWPQEIRNSPTFAAHAVARPARRFCFHLPFSQSSAYYCSRKFGQGTLCTHNARTHDILEDLVAPLFPWQRHQGFSCTCHLRAISRPSRGDISFLGNQESLQYPHFPQFMLFFFPDIPLHHVSSFAETLALLFGVHQHIPKDKLGRNTLCWQCHGWWHELWMSSSHQQLAVYLRACLQCTLAHSRSELGHSNDLYQGWLNISIISFLLNHS